MEKIINKLKNVPIFGIISLENKIYYYDKLMITLRKSVLSPKNSNYKFPYFYYSKQNDDIINDINLLKKLEKKLIFIMKLKEIIFILKSKILKKNFEQAIKDFPIGFETYCNTKYGGILKIKVKSVSKFGDKIKIVDIKYGHSYNIERCMKLNDLRYHKLKNII